MPSPQTISEFALSSVKKYGVFGLLLLYFLYQDNATRELDRADRKNNIELMGVLTKQVKQLDSRVNDIDGRVKILEFKVRD